MCLRETLELTDYLTPLTTEKTVVNDYWKVLEEFLKVIIAKNISQMKNQRLLTLGEAKVE